MEEGVDTSGALDLHGSAETLQRLGRVVPVVGRRGAAVTENAKTCVAYTLLDGRKGQVPVETIDHVSLLSDGRGVMYTKAGRVIVVCDGLKVLEQWRRAGPSDELRTVPPAGSK